MKKIDHFLRRFWGNKEIDPVDEFIQKLDTLSDKDRIRLENWVLNKVLNVPIVEDILTRNENEIFVGGRKLSISEVTQVRSEVKVLRKFKIWAIMNANVLNAAHKMMTRNAESYEGMRGGKFIEYTLDMQNNILNAVENPTFDEKMIKVVQSNRKNKI